MYQLHRCVYDYVRAGEVSESQAAGGRETFDAGKYDLNDEEKKAFEAQDVAQMYQLGLHPVLLNRFCRASGYSRDDYRKLLEPFGAPEERKARWQR